MSAKEYWASGFTKEGIPIVHSENDGTWIRSLNVRETEVSWERLPTHGFHDCALLKGALSSAIQEFDENKNKKPLERLRQVLLDRGELAKDPTGVVSWGDVASDLVFLRHVADKALEDAKCRDHGYVEALAQALTRKQ